VDETSNPQIPTIPEEELTPSMLAMLELCTLQREIIQKLKDEVARLKGEKARPKIRPSRLEEDPARDNEKDKDKEAGKRPGSAKRSKTAGLTIHEERKIKPENVPEGSTFRGYHDYTVQDIVIGPQNTRYRMERWETPSGEEVVGKLPEEVRARGHFGPTLIAYVMYQYHNAHVTQPLILEHLLEIGVDISAGMVNQMINVGKDDFHAEKDEILRAGLEVSGYVHVDDTGARHQGRNGYCTHIGNELFAWFESTQSKSRINFLTLLQAGRRDYRLNSDAIEYMRAHKLPRAQLEPLAAHGERSFGDLSEWEAALDALGISDKRHVRIATEGALVGSVLEHGFNRELVIVSDDAGQFNAFLHALCWIHAERTINKLVGFNEEQREAVESIRTRIWELYADLKRYKEDPSLEKKAELEARFDEIFTTKTCYVSLNLALDRLFKNKAELLLVLKRPDIPLHNNLSEGDIRDYVKKRKISGSTRGKDGRRCRDTFASLKKTTRKLGISFWEYLKDRGSGDPKIPPLADLIRLRARQLQAEPEPGLPSV